MSDFLPSLEELESVGGGVGVSSLGTAATAGLPTLEDFESVLGDRHTAFGKSVPIEIQGDLKGLVDSSALETWEKNPTQSFSDFEKELAGRMGAQAGLLKSNADVRRRARDAYLATGRAIYSNRTDLQFPAEGEAGKFAPKGYQFKDEKESPQVDVDLDNRAKAMAEFNEKIVPEFFRENYNVPEEERQAILDKYKAFDPEARKLVKTFVQDRMDTNAGIAKGFDEYMSKKHGAVWNNAAGRALFRGASTFSSKIAGFFGGAFQGQDAKNANSLNQANLRDVLAAGAGEAQDRTGASSFSRGLEEMGAGATDSLLTSAAGGFLGHAIGGTAAATSIGSGIASGLTTTEDAYGRGLQRGFSNTKNLAQAGFQGLMETGLEIAGNKIFGPGIERAFAPQAASQLTEAIKGGLLKRARAAGLAWTEETVMRALEEMPPELATTLMQGVGDKVSGMDTSKMTEESLLASIGDTIAQTAFQTIGSRITAEPLGNAMRGIGDFANPRPREGMEPLPAYAAGQGIPAMPGQPQPAAPTSAAPTQAPGAPGQPVPTTNNVPTPPPAQTPSSSPESSTEQPTTPTPPPPSEAADAATGEDDLPAVQVPVGDRGITPARFGSDMRQHFEPDDIQAVLKEFEKPTADLLVKYGAIDSAEEVTPEEVKAFADAVLADFQSTPAVPAAQNQPGAAPAPASEPNVEQPAEAATGAPAQPQSIGKETPPEPQPGKEIASGQETNEAPQAKAGVLEPSLDALPPGMGSDQVYDDLADEVAKARKLLDQPAAGPAPKSIGKPKQPVDRDVPVDTTNDAPDDKYNKIKQHKDFVTEYPDTDLGTSAVVLRSVRKDTPFAVRLYDTDAGRPVDLIEYYPTQEAAEKRARDLAGMEDPEVAETAAEPTGQKDEPIGKNSKGQDIYEDANGVRSVQDGGARVTEPVRMIPTRSGLVKQPAPRGPGSDFEVAENPAAPAEEPKSIGKKESEPLPEGAVSYHSGLSRSNKDLDEAISNGAAVGVSMHRPLSQPIRQKLVDYANNGGKVFVDSGAFTAFKKGQEIDWDSVLFGYREMLMNVDEASRGNVMIVAPDIVGNHEATMELQWELSDKFRPFLESGADVVLPVQKGGHGNISANVADLTNNFEAELMEQFIVGVPFNAAAWSQDDVLDFMRHRDKHTPGRRIHLLGGGPSKLQSLLAAAKAEGLSIEGITGDAMPKTISGRKNQKAKEPEQTDSDEAGMIDPKSMSPEELKAFTKWKMGRGPKPEFLDKPKTEAKAEPPVEAPKTIGKPEAKPTDTESAIARAKDFVGDFNVVSPQTNVEREIVAFARKLEANGGPKLVLADRFANNPGGGLALRKRGHYFIDQARANNPEGMWGLLGHEFSHASGLDDSLVAAADPDDLKNAIADYRKRLVKAAGKRPTQAFTEYLERFDKDEKTQQREGMAILIERMFSDEEFRAELNTRKPGFVKKVIDALIAWLGKQPKVTLRDELIRQLQQMQKELPAEPKTIGKKAKRDIQRDAEKLGAEFNERVETYNTDIGHEGDDSDMDHLSDAWLYNEAKDLLDFMGEGENIYSDAKGAQKASDTRQRKKLQEFVEKYKHLEGEFEKELAAEKPAKEPAVTPERQAYLDKMAKAKELAQKKRDEGALTPGEDYALTPGEANDEEVLDMSLDLVVAAVQADVTKFADLVQDANDMMGAELAKAMMPYLRQAWNTIRSFSNTGKGMDTAPEEETAATSGPAEQLAQWVSERLNDPQAISEIEFFGKANEFWGGSRAEGKYGDSSAYDALESGVNKYLLNNTDPTVDAESAKKQIATIEEISNRIPRHKGRTGNKDNMQQFSTPPAYSYLAAWVTNLNDKDTVLEPSAGAGGLVVPALNSGATVYANEIDPERAAFLKDLPVKEVFTEDAEYIDSILKGQMPAPSAIVMNPPFSRAGHKMGDKMVQGMDLKHLDAALRLLKPGGRLVAIVGAGLHGRGKGFEHWLADNPYAVRADLEIGRDIYKSHGTTFPTRLLVIDKTTDGKSAPKTGSVETLAEAVDFLSEVRDARVAETEQQPAQSIGKKDTAGTEAGRGPSVPVQSPTDEARPGTTTGSSTVPSEQVQQPTSAESGPADGGRAGASTSTPAQSGNAGGKRPGGRSGKPSKSIGKPAANRPSGQSVQQPAGISTDAAGTGNVAGVEVSTVEHEAKKTLSESTYDSYQPQIKIAGAKPHPASLVESAAMSAIRSPAITYSPKISPQVIAGYKTADGTQVGISDVQLESVAMAGQAHQTILPNGERRGFMIGDGTGVGKAREAAGVIMDNVNQGRKKAVWISKNGPLFDTAKTEWKKVGGNPDSVFSQEKIGSGEKIKQGEGILFTTYSRMSGEASDQARAAGNTLSRLEQIIDWVGGEDFDGVIILDESHEMGSSMERGTGLSKKKASNKGLAGVDLQKQLPKARIVYLSATSATEVENLAYATRLGLWGAGTAFPDRNKFMESIGKGGVAAMEKIAGDMKAMGMYIARNIAFDDGTEKGTVITERMEHTLTESQRAAYDKMAEAWSIVFANMKEALEETGANTNGQAVGRARGAFWSANQRFWNQVITAMQTPSVIRGIERDLANGKSVVIQLTNTNEAGQKRALAGMNEDDDLSDVDVSPRYILMDFIERSFPTTEYEEYMDENGNVRTRPVMDSKGNPVKNAKAEAKKQELLDQLGSLQVGSRGAMDMIIDHFGAEAVAEITGRSERLVEVDGKTVRQKRTPSATKADSTAFMDGKKRILIFSEAGGTGQSYHADLSRKNQEQRIHYLLQAGWKADAAIQGLGRTHRSNQAHAPKYVLVHTDLKGQKRFISTIARRLAQLGALTKGQRQAGDSGVFNAADNLESTEAKDALIQFYRDAMSNAIPEIDTYYLETTLGLKMRDKDGNPLATLPPITQFMNRVLSLPIDKQNAVFDAFQERIDDKVNQARANGTLDQGMETVRADGITKNSEQVVYTHDTGAQAKHVVVTLSRKTKPKTWDEAQSSKVQRYVRSEASGKVWAVEATGSYDQDQYGVIDQKFRMVGPMGIDYKNASELKSDNWTTLTKDDAEREWNEMVEKSPPFSQEKKHLLTGVLLPVWDRLPENTNQVVRLLTDDGEQILGRVIPAAQVSKVLGKLGVHVDAPKLSAEEAVAEVLGGKTVVLSNGWRIKRSRVQGEQLIELIGPDHTYKAALDRAGVFDRRLDYKVRYFIPMGAQAPTVMGALLKSYPITEVRGSGDSEIQAIYGGMNDGTRAVTGRGNRPTEVRGVQKAPLTAGYQTFADKLRSSTQVNKDEAIAARDILKTWERIFDVPMKAEGYRMKADAIYKTLTETVRFRNKHTANLAVKMHEVGHHIDNVNGLTDKSNGMLTKLMRDQLRQMDYAPQKHSKQLQVVEGFAEFIRHYVTEQNARDFAPEFYDWFTKTWMPKNPTWAKALNDAKAQAEKFAGQGVFERMNSAIGAGPAVDLDYVSQLEAQLRDKLSVMYDNTLDRNRPLQLLEEAAAKGGVDFDHRASAYEAAMVLGGSSRAMAGRAIDDGVHLLSHHAKISEPLYKAAKENIKNAVEYDEAMDYAVARHLDWYWKNVNSKYEGPVDPRDVQRWLDYVNADPDKKARYEKVAVSIARFGNALLDMKVDAGASAIDAARAKQQYGDYYFPMRRVKDADRGQYSRSTKFVNLSKTGMKGRTKSGSGEAIMDPYEAMMEKTIDAYAYATQKLVEGKIFGEADPKLGGARGLGYLIDEVDPKTEVNTGTIEEILGDLVKADVIDAEQKKAMLIAAKIKRGEPLTEVYDKDGNLKGGERKWFADKHGIDPLDDQAMDEAAHEEPDAMAKIALYRNDFTPSAADATVLRYDRAGTPRLYQLDRRLYNAVNAMHPVQQSMMLGFLKPLMRMFRVGAASGNTIFALGQVFSDYFQSLGRGGDVTSPRYAGKMLAYKVRKAFGGDGKNALIDVWETNAGNLFTELGSTAEKRSDQRKQLLGLRKESVNARVWELVHQRWGNVAGIFAPPQDQAGISPRLKNAVQLFSPPQALKDAFHTTLDRLEALVSWSDAPPRLAAMEAKARELGYRYEGNDWYSISTGAKTTLPGDAVIKMMYAAAEATVNFKRMGNWMVKMSPWFPFMSAGVNANFAEGQQIMAAIKTMNLKTIGKAAKTMSEKKVKRMGIAYAVYLAASMAAGAFEWWLRHDDEDWKAMEDYEKEKNFTLPGTPGNTGWHIPKPRDLGGMLANFVSGYLENTYNPKEHKPLFDVLARHAGGRLIRPTGPLMTMAEVATGWDFHRQRYVTPPRMRKMIKEKQATQYTSPFAVSAAGMLGGLLSPIEIDHLMNGFTGGGFRRINRVAESYEEGSLGAKDLPFVGALKVDRYQHATINRFYNEIDKLDQDMQRMDYNGIEPTKAQKDKLYELKQYSQLIDDINADAEKNTFGRKTDDTLRFVHGLAREALGFDELEHSVSPLRADDVPKPVNDVVKKFIAKKAKKVILSSGFPEKEHKGDKDYATTLANWKEEYNADLKWLKANKDLPKVQAMIDEVLDSSSYRDILRGKDRPKYDVGNESREAFDIRYDKYLQRFEAAEKIKETLGSKE